MIRWAYIALVMVVLAGCRKQEEEVDPIPVIELVSVSETEVVQFENQVNIVLSYADADGDLGQVDPDALSLRVKDDRLLEYDWYHIPPLTPDNQELDISGTFTVSLPPLFLLGNGTQEITAFTLQVRDRAGHWSNPVATPEITINE